MNTLIITISDDANYGNRLQNYALTNLLSKYGVCYNAHFYYHVYNQIALICRDIEQQIGVSGVKQAISVLSDFPRIRLRLARMKHMHAFTRAYIPDRYFTLSAYRGLVNTAGIDIDHIVLGSDQIWNSSWFNDLDLKLMLGSCSNCNTQRTISYAASFGISSINDVSARNTFRACLPKLDAVSVREYRGKELVEELAHIPATVVLDPTLMLTPAQWKQITKSFVSDDDKYVLTYFLGRPSAEQRQCISEYAKLHHCRVRRILDLDDPETYVAGPEDFVELFAKAQYVFTDSYHACCFSMLFHKQFTVFTRSGLTKGENMNSRMETLFTLFQLDSVVMDSGVSPIIDYNRVDELLEQHRFESQMWLDAATEK